MPTATRNTKNLPKTIASTGLTQGEYNLLRQHLKTMLVPGSVGFDGYGPGMRNKTQFLEWFQALIVEIGPIYWPAGRSERLSWPEDRAVIADLVLKVVTHMSKELRRKGKKETVDASTLGGVAGAVDRIGALHEKRRGLDVAESLWVGEIPYPTLATPTDGAEIGTLQEQMVLPLPHNGESANEDDWEQFVNWEMCGQEEEEDA